MNQRIYSRATLDQKHDVFFGLRLSLHNNTLNANLASQSPPVIHGIIICEGNFDVIQMLYVTSMQPSHSQSVFATMLAMLLLISTTTFHLFSPFLFTLNVSLFPTIATHCYSSHVTHRHREAHACMACDCTALVWSYTYDESDCVPQPNATRYSFSH